MKEVRLNCPRCDVELRAVYGFDEDTGELVVGTVDLADPERYDHRCSGLSADEADDAVREVLRQHSNS